MAAVSTDLFHDLQTPQSTFCMKNIFNCHIYYYLDAFPSMGPLKNTVGTPSQKRTKIKVRPDTTGVYAAKKQVNFIYGGSVRVDGET